PISPNKMVIAWRQFDNIQSNFRQAGSAFSTNKGISWTFPGVVIENGIFRSDPILATDANGKFYLNSLTSDSSLHCSVFKSDGDGIWDQGTSAFGGDKAWMVIDHSLDAIYSKWSYGSNSYPCDFTRSFDFGEHYEICSLVPNDLFWGSMDIGPASEVYIIGNNGTVLRSNNAKEFSSKIDWEDLHSGINLEIKFVYLNGNSPNPDGLLGQSWVSSNHSNTIYHGEVYTLASVVTTNMLSPTDVVFARYSNTDKSWSQSIIINDDHDDKNWQWFGTMSVAPNGRIDIVWLDTRDNPGTYLSSLYYSNSFDGGRTWSKNERLSESFDPHIGWPQQRKLGDYYHMISDNEGANLAWAATFNGEQDVYYSYIYVGKTSKVENLKNTTSSWINAYPNPLTSKSTIQYSIPNYGQVQINIVNCLGTILFRY
ncbi:MAG: sialidase family protein, partial [Saprospiraceae bacterium]